MEEANKSQPLLGSPAKSYDGENSNGGNRNSEALNRSTESLIPRSTSESSLELPIPSAFSMGGEKRWRKKTVYKIAVMVGMFVLLLLGFSALYFFGLVAGRGGDSGKIKIDTAKDTPLFEQSTFDQSGPLLSDDNPDSPLFIDYEACAADFNRWAIHFKREYKSFGEERTRKEIFDDTVKRVCDHNKNKSSTFTMGLNQFSDVLPLEMRKFTQGFTEPEIDYDQCTADFQYWMVYFGKFYNSKAEEDRRRTVFDNNVKYICSHNNQNKGLDDAVLALNELSDLTHEEIGIQKGFGVANTSKEMLKKRREATKPYLFVDWSTRSDPKCTADFENWKNYFGVSYSSHKEFETRRRIFNENVKFLCFELRDDTLPGNEFSQVLLDRDFDMAEDEKVEKPKVQSRRRVS